jgi:hypothetical protein
MESALRPPTRPVKIAGFPQSLNAAGPTLPHTHSSKDLSCLCFLPSKWPPRDPILGLNEQFAADTNPNKVNLGVGVYFDDNGKLPLLQCVQAAEKAMMDKPAARGYLPIDGIAAYDSAVKGLVFGAESDVVKSGRVATVQAIGGTGGLKIGADFLKKVSPNATVLISDPSWENHRALFTNAGFAVDTYPYFDQSANGGLGGINFDGMLAALNAAAEGTIVLLHACCHNPTGYDITPRGVGSGDCRRQGPQPHRLPGHGLSGLRLRHRRRWRRDRQVRGGGPEHLCVHQFLQKFQPVRRACRRPECGGQQQGRKPIVCSPS